MALRRGVGCVVSLLVLACMVSAAGIAAVWYVVAREPSVAQNSTLVLRLDTDLHEASSDDVVRQVLGGNQSSRSAPSSTTSGRRRSTSGSAP